MRDPNNLAAPAPARPFSGPVASGASGLGQQILFPALLTAVAVACATFTASQLDALLSVPGYGLLGLALFFLLITAPFISLTAIFAPAPSVFAVLKAHAAVFICCVMFVLTAASGFGHLPGDDRLMNLFLSVLFVILAFELMAVMYSKDRIRRELGEAMRTRFLLTGLTSAIVVGCCAGGWAWSEAVPTRVVAGAETEAGTSPCCITFNGKPARRRADLTGRPMRARWDRGFAGNFHAVPVIEAPTGRRHLNWSCREDKFQPLNERITQQARRDPQLQCEPAAHLARSWL